MISDQNDVIDSAISLQIRHIGGGGGYYYFKGLLTLAIKRAMRQTEQNFIQSKEFFILRSCHFHINL